MSFTLPEYPPERFPRSPLIYVVCQLQFHELLSVSKEPIEFQERVRDGFPQLERMHQWELRVDGDQSSARNTIWKFSSRDQRDTLSLRTTSLALESRGYRDFPSFLAKLTPALQAMRDTYRLEQYTRVGLRYINEVARPFRDGQRPDWRSWLNSELLPAFALRDDLGGYGGSAHSVTMIRDNGTCTLRYGINRGQLDSKDGEALVLDIDYSTRTAVESEFVADLLRSYNDWIYRLFRWSMGDALLQGIRTQEEDATDDAIYGATQL